MEFIYGHGQGAFGAFNAADYQKHCPLGTSLNINPKAQTTTDRKQGHIGVYLPMGLGAKVERNGVYTAFYEPMSRYEILYRNYFGVGRQRDMVLH